VSPQQVGADIRPMPRLGLTPREFGLKVRAHPDSLIVTARNKMRSAKTVDRVVAVSEQVLEPPQLFCAPGTLGANAAAVREFLTRIEGEGVRRTGSLIGT